MNRKIALLAVVGALVLSILACSSGSNPTQTQVVNAPVTNTPVQQTSGDVTIVNQSAFTTDGGTYYVVGLVRNDSTNTLDSIELTIEIKDASGNSLLKDFDGNTVANQTFQTLLYTLTPGESSPFQYYYDTSDGVPASYNVTVSGQQTGQTNRVALQVENTDFYNDNSGTLYLSGELVNTSTQWVYVNYLAAAAVDAAGNVLSADSSFNYSSELTPSDDPSGNNRTPFSLYFPAPTGASSLDWQVYVDAETYDAPTRYSLSLQFTNSYFDDYGSFHMVGTVTNNDTEVLNTGLVAGLYDADQKVLDAGYTYLPLYLEAGATIPFDITGYSSIDYNPDQAARLDNYTAQIDYWSTYPTSRNFVSLSTTNDTIERGNSTLTVTGDVVNDSGQVLSDITVIVSLLDADNNIVATSYTYLTPDGDSFAAGETGSYTVYLYPQTGADTSNYTVQTLVQGDVK